MGRLLTLPVLLALGCNHLLEVAAVDEYAFVNLAPLQNYETVYADDTGTVTVSLSAGIVKNFARPTCVVQRYRGQLWEGSNVASAGTDFVVKPWLTEHRRFRVHALHEAATIITKVNGSIVSLSRVPAGLTAGTVLHRSDAADFTISSTADFLLLEEGRLSSGDGLVSHYMPLFPAAQTIFGQCPEYCEISILGDDPGVPIERACTNGSIDVVYSGFYQDTGSLALPVETCRWSAPAGYRIGGRTRSTPELGFADTSLVPLELFQRITPLPLYMDFLVLMGEKPAVCTYDGGANVTLVGSSGLGVFHARLEKVVAGTVFKCSEPVAAIGNVSCVPGYEAAWCATALMHLIVAPTLAPPLTNTTTATAYSTTTHTTTATTAMQTTGMLVTTFTATGTNSTATATTTTVTTRTAASTSAATLTRTAATTTTATATTTTNNNTNTTPPPASTSTATTPASTSTPTTSATYTSSSTATVTLTSTGTSTTLAATTTTTTTLSSSYRADTSVTTLTATVAMSSSTLSPVAAILQRVEKLEASLLSDVLLGNVSTSTRRDAGYTAVAVKIDASALAAGGSVVHVLAEGTSSAATVPASFLADTQQEGVVIVLTAADNAITSNVDPGEQEIPSVDTGSAVHVSALTNVEAFTLAGEKIEVLDLTAPIRMIMPVNRSAGQECAFWKEADSKWASDGVAFDHQLADGRVVCTSSHLTLFAVIMRSFVETFVCSQAKLLNAEAVKELADVKWCLTPGALTLGGLIAAFLLLFAAAAWLDWRRWSEGVSDDEHLLIPRGAAPEAPSEEKDLRLLEEDAAGVGGGTEPRCASCCKRLLDWCHSSSAMRDALDDVVSQWMFHFAELRDFVEGVWEGLGSFSSLCCCRGENCAWALIHNLLLFTLAAVALRQASGSLGISSNVSCLITKDEHVGEVLRAHKDRRRSSRSSRSSFHSEEPGMFASEDDKFATDGTTTWASTPSVVSLKREENWGEMHREIEHRVDAFVVACARWSSLPCTVWRLFLAQNPFGACLARDAFTSSKQRVLFVMVDTIGALMLATVFFASVGAPGKRNRSFDCTVDDPLERIGRTLAIGTGSLLIGGIPSTILASLCTRGVKRFRYEGCPEWNRQLRVWRTQDRMIWVFGLSYLGFCVFFIVLFLANVAASGHGSWLLSGVISVVEDTVVIPLGVALGLPLLCTVCLAVLSAHRRVKKEDLVRERHVRIKSQWNMTLATGAI